MEGASDSVTEFSYHNSHESHNHIVTIYLDNLPLSRSVVAAGATDNVYGLVIYNSKREAWKAGDIVSVLRDGGAMTCVAAGETISAGAKLYYLPADGSVSATGATGALPFGIALANVVAPAAGALVMVEVVKYSALAA